jgi:hypothetical protein
MSLDPFTNEQLATLHRQDLDQEINHQLFIDSIDPDQLEPGLGRKALGSLGRTLVSFGSWLEDIEHRGAQPVPQGS